MKNKNSLNTISNKFFTSKTKRLEASMREKNSTKLIEIKKKLRNKSSKENGKYGLCVGINKFKDERFNLLGCENDAKMARFILRKNGFETKILLSKNATRKEILKELEIAQKKAKKEFFLLFSSHGSYIQDLNNDEIDKRDECWVTHDMEMIIDDEIQDIIQSFDDNTKITIVSDSCHSGTITKEFYLSFKNNSYKKSKFLPPDLNKYNQEDVWKFFYSKSQPKQIDPEKRKEILISACKDIEFAYDSEFNNTNNGALSYYLFRILNRYPEITYNKLFSLLRTKLPSENFPQTPQLECSNNNLNKKVFE